MWTADSRSLEYDRVDSKIEQAIESASEDEEISDYRLGADLFCIISKQKIRGCICLLVCNSTLKFWTVIDDKMQILDKWFNLHCVDGNGLASEDHLQIQTARTTIHRAL